MSAGSLYGDRVVGSNKADGKAVGHDGPVENNGKTGQREVLRASPMLLFVAVSTSLTLFNGKKWDHMKT